MAKRIDCKRDGHDWRDANPTQLRLPEERSVFRCADCGKYGVIRIKGS